MPNYVFSESEWSAFGSRHNTWICGHNEITTPQGDIYFFCLMCLIPILMMNVLSQVLLLPDVHSMDRAVTNSPTSIKLTNGKTRTNISRHLTQIIQLKFPLTISQNMAVHFATLYALCSRSIISFTKWMACSFIKEDIKGFQFPINF